MEALQQEAELRVENDLGPVPLVGYTPDQLQGLIRDRRPGIRQIYPDKDVRQDLANKFLRQPAPPVPLTLTPDGKLSPLEVEVAQRQVPFTTKPGSR